MYALWGDLADCETTMDFWGDGAKEPSTWSYRFDENGDLRWAELRDKAGFRNITIVFDYDALGGLSASTSNPREGGGFGSRTLVQWTPSGDSQLAFDADGDGRTDGRTYVTRVNGRAVSEASDEDTDGAPESWTTTWEQGVFETVVLEEHTAVDGDSEERASFDTLGRLTQTEAWAPGARVPSSTSWRGYDAKGRAAWKDSDNDGDGESETHAVWHWRCP